MKNLLKLVKNNFFPILIVLFVAVVAFRNYVPGTFLSGWDTLHPEFNIWEYLQRIFWGTWQGHQGVGASAAQSHAAEITRFPLITLLSFILPLSAVRYAFFFLMYLVGGLGIYYLVFYLLARERNKYLGVSSFLSAILYLTNLITLQHFYVPLEMFAVHFATLPFLILFTIKYLREEKKSNLVWFSLVTLLSTSMAHTATLFYAYFLGLLVFIGITYLAKPSKQILKKSILLVLLTVGINLFWLAPNAYYIARHGEEVSQAKISSIFTSEAILQSRAYANLNDLAQGKNFLFNWREYDFKDAKFVDLLDEWKIHLTSPGVTILNYIFFATSILGVLLTLTIRKSRYYLGLLGVGVVAAIFWLNESAPINILFDYLRGIIPPLSEALRFPFTKFSILLLLSLTVFFAVSIQDILERFSRIKVSLFIAGLFFVAQLYFFAPGINGNLISPSMKVNIPQEYFEMFKWINLHGEGRVAKMPLNTFWGWNYYSWGYQGAGFTWFGINNPTMDREFDRWNIENEGFYLQASEALYEENSQVFINTLKKYQISYLLLDENIINAGGTPDVLMFREIKDLLTNLGIKKVWEEGKLSIYETEFGKNKIEALSDYSLVGSDLTTSRVDPLYASLGNYILDKSGQGYPFVNLNNKTVGVNYLEEGVEFTNGQAKLKIPYQNKITENFKSNRGVVEPLNCDLEKVGEVNKINYGEKIVYTAVGNGVSCDFFVYPNLSYNKGYLLRIKGENVLGRNLKFYLQNIQTGRMDLEELTPDGEYDQSYFVLPKNIVGGGYILNLETRSYGGVVAENIIKEITFIEIPTNWINSVYQSEKKELKGNLEVQKIKSFGPLIWQVELKGEGILTMNSGFEQGWTGLDLNKLNVLKHTKVNSWQNGWEINNQSNVLFFYWPQIMEFLGLGIIPIIFYFVIKK